MNQLLIDATTKMNFKMILLSEGKKLKNKKEVHAVHFHVYKMLQNVN